MSTTIRTPATIPAWELHGRASEASMRRMRAFIAEELRHAAEYAVDDAVWFREIMACLERIDDALAGEAPAPSAPRLRLVRADQWPETEA